MMNDPTLRPNPADPDDPRNLNDPYLRTPVRSGGSGIALVFFGIVAVLLIGFAVLGNNTSSTTGMDNTTPPATTQSAQPEQPVVPAPPATAPSTNGTSGTTSP